MEQDELRFDIYAVGANGRIVRQSNDVPLVVAEALSGLDDRDEFAYAVMHRGWCGSNPAWSEFRPVVIMPKGHLIRKDQLEFLMELTD